MNTRATVYYKDIYPALENRTVYAVKRHTFIKYFNRYPHLNGVVIPSIPDVGEVQMIIGVGVVQAHCAFE